MNPTRSRSDDPSGEPPTAKPNGLNGAGRFIGIVSVPGAISLYLVWWMTQWLGAKIDRAIALLTEIANLLQRTAR